MHIKIYILSVYIFIFSSGCSPTSMSSSRTAAVKSGSIQSSNPNSNPSNGGNSNASLSSSSSSSGASSNTSSSASTIVTSSGFVANLSTFQAMTSSQVAAYYNARIAELKSDQENYAIDSQIATALCMRINQLRTQCPVSNPIIPTSASNLNCGAGTLSTNNQGQFSVLLTDTTGNALKSVDGQFVLVANTNYVSTPFGAGPTNISFIFQAGGSNVISPSISQISQIEIRRADENVSAILSGKGKAMPDKNTFFVQLYYNGIKLTDGLTTSDSNPTYKNFRYNVSLSTIFSLASSRNCIVSAAEMNEIKKQITTSIQTQNEQNAANLPKPVLSKDQMINAILDAESKISTVAPLLNNVQNQVLLLTSEIQTDRTIGCHANEPILQISIDIQGQKNEPKLLAENWDKCPVIPPTGPGNILGVDMGSSIALQIDQNTYSIGGPPWVSPVSNALVGDIQYLRLKKLAVEIQDQGPVCKVGFLGASSACAEVCAEINTFSITGIKISVDTPSATGVTIYQNSNINTILGSTLYSKSALMSWTADNFRGDPNWIKFMYDTNCQKMK